MLIERKQIIKIEEFVSFYFIYQNNVNNTYISLFMYVLVLWQY